MSARKTRPALGTPVSAGMSHRDVAAALGVSASELSRWKKLADLGTPEFERRLKHGQDSGVRASAASIIAMSKPVPARGRVERAMEIFKGMTPAERGQFLGLIGILE